MEAQISARRELPRELGEAIRRARESRGWTRDEVAREIGISRGHLQNLEAGRRAPSAVVAARLARLLDLDDDVIAEQLQSAAAPDRGKSSPYALVAGRPHEGGRVTD